MTDYNGHSFIEIPEGMSFLGSGFLDPFASERERPLREVFISTFRISQHPTTRSQFSRFLQDYEQEPIQVGKQVGNDNGGTDLDYADYPRTQVSWELAQAYCSWLTALCGEKVVLPTEAEWEKAARGGDERIWPWGNSFDPALCNSTESGRDGFCSVFDLPEGASPYGCMHMSGGVWEWCEDFYNASSHQILPFIDPVNLVPGPQRVVKGGSAYCTKEIVRPACRDWTNSFNQGGGDDGFRVCIRNWR